MAESAYSPVFSRGSTVLDYWLAHAEGLTVQPIGARVQEVIATAPVGRTKTLVVRTRMMHRRKEISAASIAAVDPSLGHLLLDPPETQAPRIPRPSGVHLAAARTAAARAGGFAKAHAVTATRQGASGSRAAFAWLRPRAAHAGLQTARRTRIAAARTSAGTAAGLRWLAPRAASAARDTAQVVLAVAVMVAQVAALAARAVERGAAGAVDRGRASIETRRARQAARPDD